MNGSITRLRQFREMAANAGHRHLAVLAGDQVWSRNLALEWLHANPDDECLLLSDRTLGAVEASNSRHSLGTENDCVIVDTWAGLNVNQLAAASGTLRAGGLLLLLTPTLEAWPEFAAPAGRGRSYFVQRLCELLHSEDYLSLFEPAGLRRYPKESRGQHSHRRLPTDDQLQSIEAIDRVANGHRRRPLVIRADRGRGKSAALGLSAARLMEQGYGKILLTGPRPQSVEVVFQHAQGCLSGSVRSGHSLRYDACVLAFVPPDVLLAEKPEGRLLLVDEAAAIPPAILERLLEHYARVVFATTVHGYEGTGRGFDVRFRETLDRLTPQWQAIVMQQPIRWQPGDPLEAFLNRALMLDAEPADDNVIECLAGAYDIRRVPAGELADDELLLSQVFGLLVNAHYQTAPEDLRLLLDLPEARLYVAEEEGQVLAASLVLEEGELPAELLDAIDYGERRLRGHLLPQTLAYHCAATQALTQRMARVVRIAVHYRLRRRGMGGALLRYIQEELAADEFDLMGSSFAADVRVTAFWLREDFSPLRLGTKRDSCSGSHALLVGKPLSARGAELIEQVHERFSRQFGVQLGEQFQSLDSALALQLLGAALPADGARQPDIDEVRRYASGISAYETTAAALWYYVMQQLPGKPASTHADYSLLITKVLQRRSWSDLAAQLQLRGRAEVDDRLRKAFRQLLAEDE